MKAYLPAMLIMFPLLAAARPATLPTRPALDPVLLDAAAPTADTLPLLIRELASPDPVRRELALRRLQPHPAIAAAGVAEAFGEGNLALRLSTLDLLSVWRAPIDGLDPWQPETLTRERIEALRNWAKAPPQKAPAATQPLTAELLAIRRDLVSLSQAETDETALALRERLARHGKTILPEVKAQLAQATGDRAAQRMAAMAYRLVAGDKLAVDWAGGLDRLASRDAVTRRAAARELAERATAADTALLLELFSDADAVVRETSLRALQGLGGASGRSIASLLKDPDPNVRVAVLKQLGENATSATVSTIAEYVASEQDADLVVHAVRALRSAHAPSASGVLLSLLQHPSWQVRAEVIETFRELMGSLSTSAKADIYIAMVKALDDSDSFVVAGALQMLRNADLAVAVEPMVRAAKRRPELAAEVARSLAHGEKVSAAGVAHLRDFCKHDRPDVRAAAIESLCSLGVEIQQEAIAALKDSDSRVRIAAAGSVFERMERERGLEDEAPSGLMGKLLSPFRAGKNRPAWIQSLAEPASAMLAGSDVEERLAAASMLIALGREEVALPVVRKCIKARPALASKAAPVLAWLPWEVRVAFFDEMLANRAWKEAADTVVRAFCTEPDERVKAKLWQWLAKPDIDVSLALVMGNALMNLYFAGRPWSEDAITPAQRAKITPELREKAKAGPDLQRTVALALLLNASLSDAGEIAAGIADNPASSDTLRVDAFRVRILSGSVQDGQKLSIAALADRNSEMRKSALAYLTVGSEGINQVREHLDLRYHNPAQESESRYSSQPKPIKLAVPEGLKPEMVRPFLTWTDEQLPIYASYHLATMGDRSALDRLIGKWREKKDAPLRRLLYRAIAIVGDDSLSGILEEIYGSLGTWDSEVRNFYWTVRSMDGPNVLKLRKRIRDERGMDRLR